MFQSGNVILINGFDIPSPDVPCRRHGLYVFGNARFALLQLQVGGFGQFFRFFEPSIQTPDLPFSLASVRQYSIKALPYPFPLGLPKTHKQYR